MAVLTQGLKSQVSAQSKQLQKQEVQMKTLQQGMKKLKQEMKLALTFSPGPTATPTTAPTDSPTTAPTFAPTGVYLSPFQTPVLSAKLNMTLPDSPAAKAGDGRFRDEPRTMVGLTPETAIVCSWDTIYGSGGPEYNGPQNTGTPCCTVRNLIDGFHSGDKLQSGEVFVGKCVPD